MGAFVRGLAVLVGVAVVSAAPAFGSPVGAAGGAPAGQARLAALPEAGFWCPMRPTIEPTSQKWWIASTITMRPKWIVQPRWPQLFADGRQSPLSLDPILRRHWWD